MRLFPTTSESSIEVSENKHKEEQHEVDYSSIYIVDIIRMEW